MARHIYRRHRSTLLREFDDTVMGHRMRLFQLLQQPMTEQTSALVQTILDDMHQQLTKNIPARLQYLTEP